MTTAETATPTLLAVAPNGARKTKKDHPKLPLSSIEIGQCAKQCMDAGAGMIHLHVRDTNQQHSLAVDDYKEAIKQIRLETDDGMFIQVTSEAVGLYTPEQQFLMIHELNPPAVSIGLREIKLLNEQDINQHFIKMRTHGVFPQLILYNQIDFDLYEDWLARGVLPGSAYPLLFVIGKQQPEGSFEQLDLSRLAESENHRWMVCAFGEQEFNVAKQASDLGGHVRLGFENNCLLANGSTAKNNSELISQMADYLSTLDQLTVSSKEAKKLMQPDW